MYENFKEIHPLLGNGIYLFITVLTYCRITGILDEERLASMRYTKSIFPNTSTNVLCITCLGFLCFIDRSN